MTEIAPVPGYEFLGRVVDSDGATVGTCFQVEPGILVTALHVLSSLGVTVEGDAVSVGPIAGGWLHKAVVARTDDLHDLAVLRTGRSLPHSRIQLARSDTVRAAEEVRSAGFAEVEDGRHDYPLLPAGGKWRGLMKRNDLLWARIQADAVMPGMSGAPVLRVSDGRVVGVVSARYRSDDEFMNGSVWVARTEDLLPLLDGLAQESVNDLHRADEPPNEVEATGENYPHLDLGVIGLPPVPPALFGLGIFTLGQASAAASIGFRYGDAPAMIIISPVAVSSLLSIGGVVHLWLCRSSRSGIDMWALGTALLFSSINSSMMLPPDMLGRGLTVLFGVTAFWMIFPLALRLLLGFPDGALSSLTEQRLVRSAFWLGSTAALVVLMTKTDVPACRKWCGKSPLQLIADPEIYLTIRSIMLVLMAGLTVTGLATLARKFHRSTPTGRSATRPLLMLSIAAGALYAAYSLAAISHYLGRSPSIAPWNEISMVLGWLLGLGAPILFLVAAGRRLVTIFRLQSLAQQARYSTVQQIERALGEILGDPNFCIARQADRGWQSASGSIARSPGSTAQTIIPGTSPPVIVFHDAYYLKDRDIIDVIIRLVSVGLFGKR